jgi:hypothetical protein
MRLINEQPPTARQAKQRREMCARTYQKSELYRAKERESKNGNACLEGGQAEINAYLRKGVARW